jgi:serine protease Do
MIQKIAPASMIVGLALLAGCATNDFKTFYSDDTAGIPAELLATSLEPFSGKTTIYGTQNYEADARVMQQRGFTRIGVSGFVGAVSVTNEQLLEQAKFVGADAILYTTAYEGSEVVTSPLITYKPGTTSTTYNTGTANANAYGSGGSAYGTAMYSGTSTTTTPGTYSTTMIQSTVERHSHTASFWRKAAPSRLGVITKPLPEGMRQALQRNGGLVVDLIVDNSPAFHANLLPGDVIISLSEMPVSTEENLYAALDAYEGKPVKLTVLRNGEERVLDATLGKRRVLQKPSK